MPTAATAPPLARAAEESIEPEITVLHADYFEQILPAPPVICGRSLKPISIGRYRRMARLKVAFVGEVERPATAGDLLLGVLICSMRCNDFDEAAAHPKFIARIKKWGRKIGFFEPNYFSWPLIGGFLKKKAGARIAAADARYLQEQMALFQKYISEGAPDLSQKFWSQPSDECFSGTHWSQNIESVMREFQNWSSDDIDEQPLTKALWDFYKHLENRGLGRFLSPDEQKELETPLTPEQLKECADQAEKLREFLKKREAANGQ